MSDVNSTPTEPWKPQPVSDYLATLREQHLARDSASGKPRPDNCEICAALARVEAEIARLREQDSKWDTTYRQSRDEIRRLEVEVARLREEARRGQEPLARLVLDATTIHRAHKIARAALLAEDGAA